LTSRSDISGAHRPSICLFEWNKGGHFTVFTRAAAEALVPGADVTLAASDPMIEELSDLPIETYSLGAARPSVGGGDLPAGNTPEALAGRELGLLREACAAIGADHCFHLYTDPVLRWWLRESPMPSRMSIAIFHPIGHYRKAYGSRLSARQRARGAYLEHKLRGWRARSDAHAVFSHDPIAAASWTRRRGAQSYWLPEPPAAASNTPSAERRGCVLFGAIDRRKGFDLLADAVSLAPTDLFLRIAGHVAPGVRGDFDECVERMRASGAKLELHLDGQGDVSSPADALADARCTVLPYRPHFGLSRVMYEAAALGTPVVGPSWGSVGHLIREYGLGLVVDPADPVALREAILELTEDPEGPARYAPGLARYAADRGGSRFGEQLQQVFGLRAAHRSDRRTRPRPASDQSPV
jgi:glycosyltransferase involved in cell wall biosynthesis